MWSRLWSILVCKIPQFGKKLPIRTTHHTFLESRHPEVTKNPYCVLPPEGSQNIMQLFKQRQLSIEQKCLTASIVYKAKVTSSNQNYQKKVHFGLCETAFKRRFSNQKKSFNLNEYRHEAKLSNKIWRIQGSSHHPKVKLDIVKKCVPYNSQTKRCLLCLNEKLEIAAYKDHNLLNRSNEIVSKCRHQLKYALSRYDTKD